MKVLAGLTLFLTLFLILILDSSGQADVSGNSSAQEDGSLDANGQASGGANADAQESGSLDGKGCKIKGGVQGGDSVDADGQADGNVNDTTQGSDSANDQVDGSVNADEESDCEEEDEEENEEKDEEEDEKEDDDSNEQESTGPPHNLLCHWCRQTCTNRTIKQCNAQQNRCFHYIYNDDTIEKGCIIDKNWPTIRKKRNATHDGLKDSTYICEGDFCNDKDV